ncbi:MAG: hypothetical protein P8L44_00085 [Opitutales bacterium]|nr:hypothetical protein [Opitutales bacterium]
MTKKILTVASAFLAIVFFAFLISNPLTGEEHTGILNFIGRFHPVVLHLPIGFFVLLAIFELITPVYGKFKEAATFILILTIGVTILAVSTGILLAYAGGADEPLVVYHMRVSLILGILTLELGVLKLYGGKAISTVAYKVTLFACLLMLFVSSHNGGSITHGEDYLTKHMPNALRTMFGLEIEEVKVVASVDDLEVYGDVVHTIFEQNCNTCHNPNKKKGDLDMESYEGLLKGGEMGYSIAAGELEDSELYYRITLPHDDEDFMPTDGKPPLSDTEVEVIGWWIQEGADPVKTVGAHDGVPGNVYSYFQSIFDSMVSDEELERRRIERENLYLGLTKLHDEIGLIVIPIESEASEFSIETFAIQKTFDDSTLAKLVPYADKVVEANFSSTQLTDEALDSLLKFENLRSLNLSKTKIQGQQFNKLVALKNLESLNLYGTELSSERVSELSQLTQLKNLYLFQTELYEESVLAQLKESLPNCNFVLN